MYAETKGKTYNPEIRCFPVAISKISFYYSNEELGNTETDVTKFCQKMDFHMLCYV